MEGIQNKMLPQGAHIVWAKTVQTTHMADEACVKRIDFRHGQNLARRVLSEGADYANDPRCIEDIKVVG